MMAVSMWLGECRGHHSRSTIARCRVALGLAVVLLWWGRAIVGGAVVILLARIIGHGCAGCSGLGSLGVAGVAARLGSLGAGGRDCRGRRGSSSGEEQWCDEARRTVPVLVGACRGKDEMKGAR